jgi:deoxyribodipyrimidine photo-lyase
LADNPALDSALRAGTQVVPVFVLDPRLLGSGYVGERRLGFLWGGLRALDANLRRRGSRLVVRQGDPAEALAQLVTETQAQLIFAQEDFSPYGHARDERVAARLPLRLTDGLTVHHPAAVVNDNGAPYAVYTPFSRAWRAKPQPGVQSVLPAPDRIATPDGLASEPLPIGEAADDFLPGEGEAHTRLQAFGEGLQGAIYQYADGRDWMAERGTSRLSPYLRFGMVSARQAAVAALLAIEAASSPSARRSADTWLSELIWREFYMAILYHFPVVRRRSFRQQLRSIRWENDESGFEAWSQGRTGYPVVDAAMRELNATGWMHNRARMIVASFLTKDLLIDWRWGERYFMQQLIDGDPGANNGGWQWTAGTGTDAAPYFRVFNPVLQGRKFDPQGAYIRRWVPELAPVPVEYIHQPWEMPDDVQGECGCRIGHDYPARIVDHAWARGRALAAYGRAREQSQTA